MNKILLFVSTFFIALICNAQEETETTIAESNYKTASEIAGKTDTIYTKDGDRLAVLNCTRNDSTRELNYAAIGKQLAEGYKVKEKNLQYEDIFLIKKANGEEVLFYHPDTTNNEVMTVNEMRYFMDGVYVAKHQYRANGALAAGFGVGVISVLATPFIHLNLVYTPIIAALYAGGIGFTDPDPMRIIARNPEKSKNEEFMLGYREEAKRRRVVKTIIGSCVGLVTTAAIVYAFDKR